VKDQHAAMKKLVSPPRWLPDDVKSALAEGNTQAMIDANKEMYDYTNVPPIDCLTAEKWFNAPKPSASTRKEYNQWRVWNVAKTQLGGFCKEYKGGFIVEKATGRSVPPPESEDEEEEDDEEVGSEEEEENEEEEMTVAMAAVRVD